MTDTPEFENGRTVLYHLTTRAEWEEAQAEGFYRRSTRGKSLEDVGFIHCSWPHQLTQVAEFVYSDCTEELVVLVIDRRELEQHGVVLREEDGGNGQFYPHLYEPLPCELVHRVLPASFDEERHFVFTDR